MAEDFNLIYYHRETGVAYKVKRVNRLNFVILDPESSTKLHLSAWALRKSFRADKNNGKRQKKVKLDFRRRNNLTDQEPNP